MNDDAPSAIPSAAPILVTGANGNIGRELVRVLRARGAAVRAADRQSAGASTEDPGVERVRLDLRDPATYAAAARGCRALFLLRPPAIADVKTTLNPFVDAARAAGVGPVVFLSVAGAGTNKLVPHHDVEAHLIQRGGAYTLLRPGFFAQNLQDAYRRDLVEDDRLYVPAGRGRVTFVDGRDLAEVAATCLLDPDRHAGQAYTLTGPEPVTFEEAAALLTRALGRPIRYVPASIPGYLLHLRRRRGLPWAQAGVQTILHVGLRFGQAERVDPTLEGLLGRRPGTLARYIEDHAALWRR